MYFLRTRLVQKFDRLLQLSTPYDGIVYKKQLFIPKRFAHGFYVLSDMAEFVYKCSDLYHPDDEGGIRYDDPEIGIDWPIPEGCPPVLSEKDRAWGTFSEYSAGL